MGRDAGGGKGGRRADEEGCARQILEVVPQAMWLLRREMRRAAGAGLSVPQLRVLAFLRRSPGASLSAVAEFCGVADASASAMVDRLVRRGLAAREPDPSERRRVRLTLTPGGSSLFESARAHTGRSLAARLRGLGEEDLAVLADGLAVLAGVLSAAPGTGSEEP